MKLPISGDDLCPNEGIATDVPQWLVYDLVIDGTSIVGNYRAQFSQILYDNTYAGNGIWYSYRGWDPLEMGMGTQM